MKTQIARWRDAHRKNLNAKQVAHIDELLAAITPAVYSDGAQGQADRAKAQQVSRVTAQLFTPEQMRAMDVVDGTCIATK